MHSGTDIQESAKRARDAKKHEPVVKTEEAHDEVEVKVEPEEERYSDVDINVDVKMEVEVKIEPEDW